MSLRRSPESHALIDPLHNWYLNVNPNYYTLYILSHVLLFPDKGILVTLGLTRKEKSTQECKEWVKQTNRNWTITCLEKFNFPWIFQPTVLHAIDEPVIVIRTNNRDFECTKNCILMLNFPHLRFRWNFTILIIIVQYLVCVKFKFAIPPIKRIFQWKAVWISR